jgi:hypothetical protein
MNSATPLNELNRCVCALADAVKAHACSWFNAATEPVRVWINHILTMHSVTTLKELSAMWFGVDVPASAAGGTFTGKITVGDIVFTVSLTVGSAAAGVGVPNHGADDPWRMVRCAFSAELQPLEEILGCSFLNIYVLLV